MIYTCKSPKEGFWEWRRLLVTCSSRLDCVVFPYRWSAKDSSCGLFLQVLGALGPILPDQDESNPLVAPDDNCYKIPQSLWFSQIWSTFSAFADSYHFPGWEVCHSVGQNFASEPLTTYGGPSSTQLQFLDFSLKEQGLTESCACSLSKVLSIGNVLALFEGIDALTRVKRRPSWAHVLSCRD